jgi:hypothetical protein
LIVVAHELLETEDQLRMTIAQLKADIREINSKRQMMASSVNTADLGNAGRAQRLMP